MLQITDLPSADILSKFAKRYPEAEIEKVIQYLTLLRVGSDLALSLDNYLSEYNLLQSRWWVLILLMREDNLMSFPSTLASKTGVTKATMTGLIDSLEKGGLVKKVIHANDRRKFKIQLTNNGQNKLDEVMPDYYRRVGRLMGALSKEEGEVLVSILSKLQANKVLNNFN